MDIKNKRIKKEIDDIIKASLVKGYIPTSEEVINILGQNIVSKNLESPNFSFLHIYKDFSLDKLNSAKKAVADDMDIIFSCIVELYNEADKHVNRFETEKKQLDYKIKKLESELANLINKYINNQYVDSASESMVDMQSFDPVKTTCDIDIHNNEAMLKRLYSVPITNIRQINTTFSSQDVSTNGNLIDYISKKDNVWQAIVSSKQQNTVSMEAITDLGDIIDVNRIEIDAPLLKPADIKIQISKDYSKWTNVTEGFITNKIAASINTSCRYVKLILSKSEADKLVDNTYQYYFIIDTIGLFKINYAMESQIITKPIKFDKNINKMTLTHNAITPTSTSIEYYVSLNKDTPEWIEIYPLNSTDGNNGNVVTFNTTNTNKILDITIPSNISNEAYELKHLSVNGQKLYSIAELKNIKMSNYKLYKGVNAWRTDSITLSKPDVLDKSVFIGNTYTINTSYNKLLFGKPSLILNAQRFDSPTILKYSTMINCPNSTIIKAPIVSNFPVAVYLNGEIIYKGKPEGYTLLTYSFKKQKNVLEVVVNINQLNNETHAVASVDLNIDLNSISSFICAEPDELREVSLFNLRYNTNNQKDVYCIRETNDGYSIVVKDSDLRIDYRFVYDEILEEANEVLLKIVMKREYGSANITPRLKGYELHVI